MIQSTVGNMQCLILLYCSLISSVIAIISADSCTLPKTEDYTAHLSAADIIREIIDFNDNYDQRFKELKQFIKANRNLTDELDINYHLYTARNPKSNYTLEPSAKSLRESDFNPFLPTAFIIEGYTQKFEVSNRPIGKNTPITTEQLHLIGMSFGAQIAGNAGHLIPGLGRITALDAAARMFLKFPHRYRLSYNDANFVDVIHTGDLPFPKGIGFFPPIGHQNFYVNGGLNQPGCTDKENESGDPEIDLKNAKCKHLQSIFLFIASFCVDCQFIGVKCDSYENFQKGICTAKNSAVAIMGIDATQKPKPFLPKSKLYLNTTGSFPFCQMSK